VAHGTMLDEETFRWIPGRGPDPAALARMRQAFPKPKNAMGEAWFMGAKRHTFDRFSQLPIAEIPFGEFGSFLFELTSGISCFGPADEWIDWFAYVLPDLIVRSHEGLLEPTISAFINAERSLVPKLPNWGLDVAVTLGRCLMKPNVWND
jgi:hypothetical protein